MTPLTRYEADYTGLRPGQIYMTETLGGPIILRPDIPQIPAIVQHVLETVLIVVSRQYRVSVRFLDDPAYYSLMIPEAELSLPEKPLRTFSGGVIDAAIERWLGKWWLRRKHDNYYGPWGEAPGHDWVGDVTAAD